MIEIDTVHDCLELLRPLLQEGSLRLIAGSSKIDLDRTTDLTALPEQVRTLIASIIETGGRLLVVPADSFPPIMLAGRPRLSQ